MSDYGSSTQTSPDGRYHVDFWEDEVRMGCWVRLPTIADLREKQTIFTINGQVNSDVRFQSGLIAVCIWGAYSGSPFTLWLDPDQAIAWFEEEQQTKFPLADASARAQSRIDGLGWRTAPKPRPVRSTPALPDEPTMATVQSNHAETDGPTDALPRRPDLRQAALALLAVVLTLGGVLALTMLAFTVMTVK